MNVKQIKKQLKDEQARLKKDIEATTATVAASTIDETRDEADDAAQVFERTKNDTVREQLEWLLGEVEHALTKIEDGSYGKCEVCGRPIGEARLEALPTARYCIEDQQRLEKKAILS